MIKQSLSVSDRFWLEAYELMATNNPETSLEVKAFQCLHQLSRCFEMDTELDAVSMATLKAHRKKLFEDVSTRWWCEATTVPCADYFITENGVELVECRPSKV